LENWDSVHLVQVDPSAQVTGRHFPAMNVAAPANDTLSESTEMIASHHPGAEEMDAYERVLGDAMAGDARLFAREDYVEDHHSRMQTRPDRASLSYRRKGKYFLPRECIQPDAPRFRPEIRAVSQRARAIPTVSRTAKEIPIRRVNSAEYAPAVRATESPRVGDTNKVFEEFRGEILIDHVLLRQLDGD
jgi:Glucose-6-phosphate dehydrogenase, C-terminal domain